MNYPVILMMHRIQGRIRVKLSHEIVDIEKGKEFLYEDSTIEEVTYNPRIKTLIVKFNSIETSEENIIIKIAQLLASIYNVSKIRFISNNSKEDLPAIATYSLISIVGAIIAKYVKPNMKIQDFVDWLATGTTLGAVFEHAYGEIKEKGTIDPEVMSIIYLINSIGKGNMLNAALVTWITTFGRHILSQKNETFIISLKKVQACYKEEISKDDFCYEVSVLLETSINKRIDSYRLFANEIIETQKRCLNPCYNFNRGNMYNQGMFFNI